MRKKAKKSPGPKLIRGMKQLRAKMLKPAKRLVTIVPTCERPTLGMPYDTEKCDKPGVLHSNGKWYCHEHRPFKVRPVQPSPSDEAIEKVRAIVWDNDISDKYAIEQLRDLLPAKGVKR